jgi:hypothetical protein
LKIVKQLKSSFLLFPFLLIGLHGFGQKTDKVLLDNHDVMTGEIKKLDYAKLSYKTDAAGTVQLRWDKIYQIKSDKYFEIILSDGIKYFGTLNITPDEEKYKILVITSTDSLELDMNQIVELTPIKNRFWTRLDGSLDMGISYTKASDVKQWNGSFQIEYRPIKSLTQFTTNSILTDQPDRDRNSKQDVTLMFQRFIKGKFAYTGFTGIQQNSELGIKLRSAVGVGMSKNWLRSNLTRLMSTLAVIVNQENTYEESSKTQNIEGLIKIEYRIFRYRDPEINLTSYFDFYPSFTISGRYRTDSNIQLKYEIFNNFYLGGTFYNTYDSKPPEGANSGRDWGITTSIGYTF